MGLGLFAMAITIVGLESLLGKPGIPLGALLTMFIGNPISSLSSPQEFLPWHWEEIRQRFVPGAAGTLLRGLSSCPHFAQGVHWPVLAAWSVAGIALGITGRHRNDETVHLPSTLESSRHEASGHGSSRHGSSRHEASGHDGGTRHGADLATASA